MSSIMKEKDLALLKAQVTELAKGIKSESDLNDLTQQLVKMTIEAALGAELDDHLGYAKHEASGRGTGNSRNGVSKKRLKGPHGDVEIEAPRDRTGTFEPQSVYPIVYLDGIVLKIRQNKRVINKTMYLALGINMEGRKELLGLWLAESEGAKFWASVLTELKNRGLKDILIACIDGLTGFPEAIAAEYPQTKIQLCLVHRVRNSLKYVVWKDYKAVTADLKRIYQAPNLITLFEYPEEIAKVIYTTNAIESLNSVIRKATKQRKLFPTDESAMKVVYLSIQEAAKNWTMPIRNWKPALNRFMIEFGDRVSEYL